MSTEKTASNGNNKIPAQPTQKDPVQTKAPETAAKSSAAAPAADKPAANAAPAASVKPEATPAKKAIKKPVRKARKVAVNSVAARKPKAKKIEKRAISKTVKAAKRAADAEVRTVQTATKTISKQSTQIMESMMTQGKTQFDKIAQDAAKNGKEQVDAFMQAGNVFMKGFEDIAKAYISLAQTSAEKNTQAVKSLLGCKTINEYTEAQNKWAQQNFDDFMAGTTRLSELSVKVATDAFEPINDQVSKTIRKASESMAA